MLTLNEKQMLNDIKGDSILTNSLIVAIGLILFDTLTASKTLNDYIVVFGFIFFMVILAIEVWVWSKKQTELRKEMKNSAGGSDED